MINWLPTIISVAALALIGFLIRANLNNVKQSFDDKHKQYSEELIKLWTEIHDIKDDYLDEEKHVLMCGKSALEIEKLFKGCLEKFKDDIFNKLRDFETKINSQ